MKFQLVSDFKPTGDQPQAIKKLTENIKLKTKHQVLIGVTGSGKTFTIANVIQNIKRPTLVISHNKTLAAQLYQEFRDFFPHNAVCYFVSYYDYYQPEAYIPQTDTYIEKETEINEEIDKLRLAATVNLLTRKDVIVVASVSCIYNLGSPVEYGKFVLELAKGVRIMQKNILIRLADLQYTRNDYEFTRGTFRVRGNTIDLFPAYVDSGLHIEIDQEKITELSEFDPLTGETTAKINKTIIYPAKHYMTNPATYHNAFARIRTDLDKQIEILKMRGKHLEAQRLVQRTNYDLEMIQEVGFVNGIENYSVYFDGRKSGQPPYTLLDYFDQTSPDWLLVVDESHITVPQIRGMYNGDQSRKSVLIDYGFRLPSALDNRPLRFDEFSRRINQAIYVSATPNTYEISLSMESSPSSSPSPIKGEGIPSPLAGEGADSEGGARLLDRRGLGEGTIVEQLIRPTGLVDPQVAVRPTKGQIQDLIAEIEIRVVKKERTLVTTLTKRMAEELSSFLEERNVKVSYLHSDIETLERQEVLDKLRRGNFDVLVGINLLREGLDLPEVSLVVILEADKEGFLRSKTSLIQTMGRAARHIDSEVIMYADNMTQSMQEAIKEVDRRRNVQIDYNEKNNITPKSIEKAIRAKLIEKEEEKQETIDFLLEISRKDVLMPDERENLVKKLRKEMKEAASSLDFETAIFLRDQVRRLKETPYKESPFKKTHR